jgi:predicted SpoU family rRNA methylase
MTARELIHYAKEEYSKHEDVDNHIFIEMTNHIKECIRMNHFSGMFFTGVQYSNLHPNTLDVFRKNGYTIHIDVYGEQDVTATISWKEEDK